MSSVIMSDYPTVRVWPYHLLTFCVVLIWGVTFVNTKVLIFNGLYPDQIFVLRFLLAYLCIWFISPHKFFCDSCREEGQMFALGLFAGAFYFNLENLAIGLTYVNNVSFIVCTSPVVTALIAALLLREEHLSRHLVWGSVIALLGVGIVVFNGHFILKLSPAGDLLAVGAAVSWAIACILMRVCTQHYSSTFVARKIFFYGILGGLFFMFIRHPAQPFPPLSLIAKPQVWSNLAFLGFVASFCCFALWTLAIKRLGAVTASNYIYLNPVSTVVASALFLDEPMTWLAYIGSAQILLGVFIANRSQRHSVAAAPTREEGRNVQRDNAHFS